MFDHVKCKNVSDLLSKDLSNELMENAKKSKTISMHVNAFRKLLDGMKEGTSVMPTSLSKILQGTQSVELSNVVDDVGLIKDQSKKHFKPPKDVFIVSIVLKKSIITFKTCLIS
jgi:hypothetical protein